MTQEEKLELMFKCHDELDKCWAFAKKKDNIDLSSTEVIWSKRMTTFAGRAFLGENTIKLSLEILFNNPDLVKWTPAHEAAHFIAYKVYGDGGHGYRWRQVARELGISDKRCHNYTVTRRKYVVSKVM